MVPMAIYYPAGLLSKDPAPCMAWGVCCVGCGDAIYESGMPMKKYGKVCQKAKSYSNRVYGLPLPLVKQEPPLRSWGMDFVEFPRSKQGHDVLLQFVCLVTGVVNGEPTTKHCTAEECWRIMLRCITPMGGIPRLLVSDRDSRYLGVCKEMADGHRIKWEKTRAGDPKADGAAERAIHTARGVARAMLEHQVQRVVSSALPLLPLWYQHNVVVSGSNVEGFVPTPP